MQFYIQLGSDEYECNRTIKDLIFVLIGPSAQTKQSKTTTFAEIKKPPEPTKSIRSKIYGISLLRHKHLQKPTVDHQKNALQNTSDSSSCRKLQYDILPSDTRCQRRSPSPKSYPAPSVPPQTTANHMSTTMRTLTLESSRSGKNVSIVESSSIQRPFQIISTEGKTYERYLN